MIWQVLGRFERKEGDTKGTDFTGPNSSPLGFGSRMNAHRDPPTTYKFVALTANNAHEAQPFTGAELVLLDGIMRVEIGPPDVLIIDGSRYHGVAPLRSLPLHNPLHRDRLSYCGNTRR